MGVVVFGILWVFDFVVIGVLLVCIVLVYEFFVYRLIVICGNVFEIFVFVGFSVGGWGVDVIDSMDVVFEVVVFFVWCMSGVVVVFGLIDFVMDGDCVLCLVNGYEFLMCVMGGGCVFGVVMVVFFGVVMVIDYDEFIVVVVVSFVYMIVVECVVVEVGGFGSFVVVLLDVFVVVGVDDVRVVVCIEVGVL